MLHTFFAGLDGKCALGQYGTRKVIHEETKAKSSKTVSATGNDLKTNAKALKVVNSKGTELPHTGGIGTTIFYILGGLLVVGAAVILVARRRVHE